MAGGSFFVSLQAGDGGQLGFTLRSHLWDVDHCQQLPLFHLLANVHMQLRQIPQGLKNLFSLAKKPAR